MKNIIQSLLLPLLFLIMAGCSKDSSNPAGLDPNSVVKYPIADISTTAKFYSVKTGGAKNVDVQFVIVRASDGSIRSCFDACDVCYKEKKGYSQVNDVLRCNNCGNRFKIDGLGSQGKGGCWPGHLVHTIEGDSVVIKVSDLVSGEYYFE